MLKQILHIYRKFVKILLKNFRKLHNFLNIFKSFSLNFKFFFKFIKIFVKGLKTFSNILEIFSIRVIFT